MPDLKKVRKIEKVYTEEQGCTCPVVVILDDGQKAIFKYPKNPLGIIVLVNEFIAYSVLKAMGLSSPNFGVAVVDEETQLNDEVADTHTLGDFVGSGFYCEYIPSTVKASLRVLRGAKNLNEGCSVILFDAIVKNHDRYDANIIVSLADAKMYVIDHSHVLGDPEWSHETLSLDDADSPFVWEANREFYDLLIRAGAPMESRDFEDAIARIREKVSEELLEEIVREIPAEWESEVGEHEIAHAKNYILKRVENLDKIHNMIKRERGV